MNSHKLHSVSESVWFWSFTHASHSLWEGRDMHVVSLITARGGAEAAGRTPKPHKEQTKTKKYTETDCENLL